MPLCFGPVAVNIPQCGYDPREWPAPRTTSNRVGLGVGYTLHSSISLILGSVPRNVLPQF